MPYGTGTYGSKKGRPAKKKKTMKKKKRKTKVSGAPGGLTAKQRTLPPALQKKILAAKKRKAKK